MQFFNVVKKGYTWLIKQPILIYCLLGAIIYFQYTSNLELKKDIRRLENNQMAYAIKQSIQVDLTLSQFKVMEPKLDSIAKLIKIKPKQIRNVIVNQYNYKDTSISSVPVSSTDLSLDDIDFGVSTRSLEFISPIKCGYVNGKILNIPIDIDYSNIKVKLDSVSINPILDTYLYEDYERFLGFLWKKNKRYEAVTYDECQSKVIYSQKNVRIISK